MQAVDVKGTVFGEVLSELMESRGIEATAEAVAALAERSGIDPNKLLARAAEGKDFGSLNTRLIDELALEEGEVGRLSWAFAYERRPPAEAFGETGDEDRDADVEYSETYIGDCYRGCGRPATVRIHKEWVVCALHYAEHLASKRSNEASMAVGLIGPFRAEAEFHGCDNLVRWLDRIAEDERGRSREAGREMEAFWRVAEESEPDHDVRMRMGEKTRREREGGRGA